MESSEESALSSLAFKTASLSDEFNLDSILTKLNQTKEQLKDKPEDFAIDLPLEPIEILTLFEKAAKVFCLEPSVLGIASKTGIAVVGSLQGALLSLLQILNGVGSPPAMTYLFLGNIVGTSSASLTTLCIVLSLKLKYPEHIFVIRGKEESGLLIPTQMSLHHQCNRQYNNGVLKALRRVFCCLPFAAVIEQKIFCISGGLSPKLKYISEIENIRRPIECPSSGLICDLLFSSHDSDTAGWAEAKRYLPPMNGVTYNFGGEIVSRFLTRHNLDLMCNAGGSKILPEGHEFCAWKQLVTIYSSPRESSKARNSGAVLVIDKALACSFIISKFSDLK